VTTVTQFAYAMSDMAPSHDGRLPAGVVSLPEGKGCGKQHSCQVDQDGHPFIKCATCAPYLVGHIHGFAATPAGVPLTPDEMGEVEISKRQGEVSYHLAMKAMGQTMGQMIQAGKPNYGGDPVMGGQGAPPLSASALKAQLAGMDPAERAEIAEMLTGMVTAPAAMPHPTPADGTSEHPGAGQGGAGNWAESAPRKPGRPRTARAS
jgi:hypothetical protein